MKYLDEGLIIDLLRQIKNGYEYILETGKAPRIKNNNINQKLCENLEKYGYISTWEEQDEIIKINRRRKVTA